MFFRRERPKQLTFEDYLRKLQQAGFTTGDAGEGRVKVTRSNYAAVIENRSGGAPRVIQRAGILLGDEIAVLVDAGYQKFFQAPSGKRKPALHTELEALHDFQEDLREALGLVSLYNDSLGTVSNLYLYDRVEGRDHGVVRHAWEQ